MNLDILNNQQKEVVTSSHGIIRVLAGPGSGKTRTLMYRLAYLIEQGINPKNILVITFTKKAAQEITDRIDAILLRMNLNTEGLYIGTFHSICYHILKAIYPEIQPTLSTFYIITEYQQKKLLKTIFKKYRIPESFPSIKDILRIISRLKNNLENIQNSSNLKKLGIKKHQLLITIIQEYENRKINMGALDFDDLLLETFKIFKEYPSIRNHYQEIFHEILLDEGQDTNIIQYEILRQIIPPQNNFLIVGDYLQAIYSWRGARPEYFMKLEQWWPTLQTFYLEQNYRSTKTIVKIANTLGQKCHNSKYSIWTLRDQGTQPTITMYNNAETEADSVTKIIQKLIQHGTNPTEIAIIYRTNYQSRVIEDQCIRKNILYNIAGGLNFYDRKEIKDILAYLQLIQNCHDNQALRRIYNIPNRYLNVSFLMQLNNQAIRNKTSLYDQLNGSFQKPFITMNAKKLKKTLEILINKHTNGTNIVSLINYIRFEIGYDTYIQDIEGWEPDNSQIQNLNELQSAASKFDKLTDFLQYAKNSQNASKIQTNYGKIKLMTIHKAKGLEFENVFIIGCNENIFPHQYDMDNIQEARRLMYVAITRAKDKLYLSWLREYQRKLLKPSRFLKELGI